MSHPTQSVLPIHSNRRDVAFSTQRDPDRGGEETGKEEMVKIFLFLPTQNTSKIYRHTMFAKHILGREPPQGSQPEDKSVTRDSFPVPNKLMPENRSSPGAETIPSRFDGKGARGRPLPNKSVRRIPIARYLNYSAMSKRSELQRPEVPTFDKVDPNPIRPYRMVLVQADMPKMLEHSCSLPKIHSL